MPRYTFQCNACGAGEERWLSFSEHDDYRAKYPDGEPHDWHCKGVLKQVVGVNVNLGMREHFSDQLDMHVSSERQFNDGLKRKAEEYTARTGMEVHYETVDPTDPAAAGVTDAGLEATERAHHDAKNDGHKTVFS